MTSKIIPVDLPSQSYSVVIATGGLQQLGTHLQQAGLKAGQRVLVVSNLQIFRHYGDEVLQALTQAGFSTATCLLPAGERYKTWKSLQKIYDHALEHRLERGSTMVALGGGVIGDMTGFAAATWLRGIHVVQVPTSLLAMVDASIGGKTGINHPQGKNLIGAFYQPRLVLIDPKTLKTLPLREFRAGMAEVIKYGAIWDLELFQQLEAASSLQPRRLNPALLMTILERSCQSKVDIVTKDEKEAGLRAILNYGHTVGHAIESISHYRLFNHGEAVGLGMLAVGEVARELGHWSAQECQRQQDLIAKAGLPTRIPASLEVQALLDGLQLDKKVQAGRVRFILPKGIGNHTITDQVPLTILSQALQQMQQPA